MLTSSLGRLSAGLWINDFLFLLEQPGWSSYREAVEVLLVTVCRRWPWQCWRDLSVCLYLSQLADGLLVGRSISLWSDTEGNRIRLTHVIACRCIVFVCRRAQEEFFALFFWPRKCWPWKCVFPCVCSLFNAFHTKTWNRRFTYWVQIFSVCQCT